MSLTVRAGTEGDLGAMCDIYNWAIIDNHVSFDTEPYTVANRLEWWRTRDPELPCLVAEDASGTVQGFTYASWFRPKVAYRSTVETTIALAPEARGLGVGSLLLDQLLQLLREGDFHRAVAVIALPNEASVALHAKLGYRSIGVLTEVGYKLGQYWDTEIMECGL